MFWMPCLVDIQFKPEKSNATLNWVDALCLSALFALGNRVKTIPGQLGTMFMHACMHGVFRRRRARLSTISWRPPGRRFAPPPVPSEQAGLMLP